MENLSLNLRKLYHLVYLCLFEISLNQLENSDKFDLLQLLLKPFDGKIFVSKLLDILTIFGSSITDEILQAYLRRNEVFFLLNIKFFLSQSIN